MPNDHCCFRPWLKNVACSSTLLLGQQQIKVKRPKNVEFSFAKLQPCHRNKAQSRYWNEAWYAVFLRRRCTLQVSLANFLVGGTPSQTQIGTGIDLNRDWNVEFMLDALACGDKEITLNKFSLCSFIASNRKKKIIRCREQHFGDQKVSAEPQPR